MSTLGAGLFCTCDLSRAARKTSCIFEPGWVQEFLGKLVSTLAQFPPPQPSRPAVDLLVTVGQQQEYLAWHNLLPSRGEQGSLDALQVEAVGFRV